MVSDDRPGQAPHLGNPDPVKGKFRFHVSLLALRPVGISGGGEAGDEIASQGCVHTAGLWQAAMPGPG